jgi:flagellar hook-associated protein 1 FlgK
VDGARAAQSGVNLDEEMVNLMKYQHAYEGASRVITSVDSMLDTLINRTGLVGR